MAGSFFRPAVQTSLTDLGGVESPHSCFFFFSAQLVSDKSHGVEQAACCGLMDGSHRIVSCLAALMAARRLDWPKATSMRLVRRISSEAPLRACGTCSSSSPGRPVCDPSQPACSAGRSRTPSPWPWLRYTWCT